jgi:hypothetical protein
MNISAHSARGTNARGKWPRPLIIRTTLYDLLTAINAEVGADEADLAVAAVVHLLATHRLTYQGTYRPRQRITDPSHLLPRRPTVASTAPSRRIISRAYRLGRGLDRR